MGNLGQPKTVLIIGGAGWSNVGDDLIASSLKKWMQTEGCRTQIVGGPRPNLEGSRHLTMDGSLPSKLRLLWNIARAGYVLIGGGGLLDDRAKLFYRPFTRAALACRLFRTPYAFAGIGVGPIQLESSKASYLAAAQGAHRVYVRDQASKDRLLDCGVSRQIDIVNDPVLWGVDLQPRAAQEYDLTVNLRNWHSPRRPVEGYEGPIDATVVESVAQMINGCYGPEAKIALVSMSSNPGDDDSTLLDQLNSRLAATVSTFYDCSPSQVEAVISESKSVLAMRLHACLLGVRNSRQVIGLAYDPKVAQQGELLGFATISLDADFEKSGAQKIAAAFKSRSPSRTNYPAPAAPWSSLGD
ncbi:polysaccharide pyruvyl transferase CsaB [Arthrobacter sp. NicSoilB8]|nr:polysaccharide pyruvyl transferase CsaB [Arthrobacter sp. NicSoilB8]